MKTVHVCKFDPLGFQTSDGIIVAIDVETPPFDGMTLEECEAHYRKQSETLADALINNLPQGTIHQLIGVLLEKYASVYRGKQ